MTTSTKRRVTMIGVFIALSLIVLAPTFIRSGLPEWWPAKPIRLGLDLKGGIYLVLGVQTEEAVNSALNAVGNTLKAELRREKVGILRAKAMPGRQLEITLISSQGIPAVEAMVQKEYPMLTRVEQQDAGGRVKLVYRMSDAEAKEIERNSVEQAIETIRNRVDQFGVAEPQIQRAAEKRIIVQLPDVTDLAAVKRTIGSVAKLEFRLVADPSKGLGSTETIRMREGGDIRVEDEIVMTGDSIERAFVDINPATNQAEVSLKLTPTGARLFENVTGANIGRQLAIILDGVGQSAPVIQARIGGGRAQITGAFTPEEAHFLALVLRAGALPAPLEFLEQRTVGASLGADSIRNGVYASLMGSLVVILLIIAYYEKAGAVAVGALALNILFLLALLALLGATLTLPGIAGIALTVGMAVDANVLIYERIREEMRRGVRGRAAVEAGFSRAHWTIVDANLTTLLAGIILYGFGTGPIKGFAVTLCLGIATSMFAALVATRVGFEVFKLQRKDGRLSIG